MCYVATNSFAISLWLYHGWLYMERSRLFPPGRRCEVPTGFAAFPDPYLPAPPRSWIEKAYKLVHDTPMPRGGHFAAFEAPDLFTEDVRTFARTLEPISKRHERPEVTGSPRRVLRSAGTAIYMGINEDSDEDIRKGREIRVAQ